MSFQATTHQTITLARQRVKPLKNGVTRSSDMKPLNCYHPWAKHLQNVQKNKLLQFTRWIFPSVSLTIIRYPGVVLCCQLLFHVFVTSRLAGNGTRFLASHSIKSCPLDTLKQDRYICTMKPNRIKSNNVTVTYQPNVKPVQDSTCLRVSYRSSDEGAKSGRKNPWQILSLTDRTNEFNKEYIIWRLVSFLHHF